jgi:DsbC/DsbD-like thiol-disulfide interchange protein
MEKAFFLFILLLATGYGFSQVQDPVKWAFTSKKINELTFEISLTASMDAGWHVYSQATPDGGPSPTVIVFTGNPLIQLEGPVKEVGKMEQKHEPLFGVDVRQYSKKVIFVQTVKLKAKTKTAVTGTIGFMTCNDRVCLPPGTQEFSITLK